MGAYQRMSFYTTLKRAWNIKLTKEINMDGRAMDLQPLVQGF